MVFIGITLGNDGLLVIENLDIDGDPVHP